MANTSLFAPLLGRLVPAADARNEENAPAYALSPRAALAQYAATGCFNATFYATAADQLDRVLALCVEVEPAFVARTAVYCREHGHMKDMPALLCAYLAAFDTALCARIFPRVIDSPKMLRNFVQIIRSGAVGRKSLGSAPKRLVRQWLDAHSDEAVFRGSVGNAPSLADVVKMVHPKPGAASRQALYGYLIGKPYAAEALPPLVQAFEAFKAGATKLVPDVPFEMLTSLDLRPEVWAAIAQNASWQMTRMNLNTFARHGVFAHRAQTRVVAARLRNREAIRAARALPYQLLMAYRAAGEGVPSEVREALQDAMEIATSNVPVPGGKVYVCPDVSGSMQSPVTGVRRGATTAVRCVDVAALVAAAIARKNPAAEVIPFEQEVVAVRLNPRDSVMTNAEKLAAIGGGGTSTSAPLALLNWRKTHGDLVVYVSDNESWCDARTGRGTAMMCEWTAFRQRNPKARLVCIDIQPYGTTQALERADVLNVGGFSDQVFTVMSEFLEGRLGPAHWVDRIEAVEV
jgi:60 kDa SS-A/Ro ribonucleoprotein